ncbi:MAG: SUMF1/EgtB/PvdO family nonheme iron enzyme, partial [Prosthecobacter sp.]|nr:SUMF1/EgtB/PvdO family nonheme iron enzyme [Prosthecobacter sp.]
MKPIFCLLLGCLFWAETSQAVEVANVRAVQRPGTKLVDIDYDLTDTATTVNVGLEVSADGGATWTLPVYEVTGDYGAEISAGTDLRMTWDAGKDWDEQVSSQTRFRVSADGKSGEFVMVPAGSFEMGDHLDGEVNAPVHTVKLSAYAVGRYEVLSETWSAVRTWGLTHGYTDLPVGESQGDGHPMASIAWLDAVKWCNARSEMEGLVPAYYQEETHETVVRTGDYNPATNQVKWEADGYRLLTEAEWEKAARGGEVGLRFPWGDTLSHNEANFNNTEEEPYVTGTTGYHPSFPGPQRTNPVEYFPANGYGIHGMADNVWEWCHDRYLWTYYTTSPEVNPLGPDTGSYRCIRGGSWANPPSNCRVDFRRFNASDYVRTYGGFRLASASSSRVVLVSAQSSQVAVDTRDPVLVVEEPTDTALVSGVSVTDFIAVELGESQSRTYTLRNTGGPGLENLVVSLVGTHSTDFSATGLGVTSLAPGESVNFSVSFIPTALGQREATLRITSTDPANGIFEIGLTGQGGLVPVEFHWSDLFQPYDGNAHPVTLDTEPADVAVDITYDGEAEPPVLPGRYEVRAVVTNPLFKGSSTVYMRVDHRADRPVLLPEDTAEPIIGEATEWDESAAGLYDGLLHDEADVQVLVGALETIKITRTGAVTARLRMNGKKISLRGAFDEAGVWELDARQADKSHIQGQLRLTKNETGHEVIAGSLTWKDVEAGVYAPRVQAVPELTGTYTLLLPSDPAWSNTDPGGDGWALIKVSTAGSVAVTGRLGDGTGFTETSYLSDLGEWSLFTDLYRAGITQGRLGGLMAFRDVEDVSDVDGRLHWLKPVDARAALYPEGFDVQVQAVGSLLEPASKAERLLSQLEDAEPNASLNLIAPELTAGLLGEVERVISWLPNNNLRHYGPEQLSGTANRTNGQVTGTYRDPETGSRLSFTGVVLQKQGIVAGHFILGGQSGTLRILPGTSFTYPGSEDAGEALAQVATPETTAPQPVLEAIDFERAAAGLYAGVISQEDIMAGGLENLRVDARGTFTGQVWIQGFRYTVKGAFELDGSAEVEIKRPGGLPSIGLVLQLQKTEDSSDAYHLIGSLQVSAAMYDLTGERLPPYSNTDPAPEAGAWTLAMLAPADANPATSPSGDGHAALNISTKGQCTGALVLADGTKVTLAGAISREGEWSLHRGLYGNPARGFLAGKLTFREVEGVSDVDGEWRWEKQNGATPKSSLYPTGFATTRQVIGSRYQTPGNIESAWAELADDWHNVWLRL